MKNAVCLGVCLAALAAPAPAESGTVTLYSDLTSFTTAIGGATLIGQDFEGFATGTDMSGVEFLPGISATTNLASLEIFTGQTLFAIGDRSTGDTFYDISFALTYFSVAFDLVAFEAIPGDGSTAQGPGVLTVFFADLTSQNFNIFGNLLGDPIFIGLVADTPITGIRWAEAQEGNGGNEETALDNFQVVPIPEPATLVLLGAGLTGLVVVRRRMRKA